MVNATALMRVGPHPGSASKQGEQQGSLRELAKKDMVHYHSRDKEDEEDREYERQFDVLVSEEAAFAARGHGHAATDDEDVEVVQVPESEEVWQCQLAAELALRKVRDLQKELVAGAHETDEIRREKRLYITRVHELRRLRAEAAEVAAEAARRAAAATATKQPSKGLGRKATKKNATIVADDKKDDNASGAPQSAAERKRAKKAHRKAAKRYEGHLRTYDEPEFRLSRSSFFNTIRSSITTLRHDVERHLYRSKEKQKKGGAGRRLSRMLDSVVPFRGQRSEASRSTRRTGDASEASISQRAAPGR
jgi:hypothetical protein